MYRYFFAFLFASIATTSIMASEPAIPSNALKAQKPQVNIQGNPVGKKDNFTINSTKQSEKTIDCVFINTGSIPQSISVWTDVKTFEPTATFQLNPGSKTAPFQALHGFRLKLQEHWWCRVTDLTDKNKMWKYCGYFSIGDSSIKESNPFKAYDESIKLNDISYNCRIKTPGKETGFYLVK